MRSGLPDGLRILDAGCGWGLSGIYCAKNHHASVTSVDIDEAVFPFLRLHSDLNQVNVQTLNKGFGELTPTHFKGVDMMIGADICFWNSLISPIGDMIDKALEAGVRMVLMADPGRPTFEDLGERCGRTHGGRTFDWASRLPYPIFGRILKIGSFRVREASAAAHDVHGGPGASPAASF